MMLMTFHCGIFFKVNDLEDVVFVKWIGKCCQALLGLLDHVVNALRVLLCLKKKIIFLKSVMTVVSHSKKKEEEEEEKKTVLK